MVETSEGRLQSHAFRDLHASKNFIRGSELIQQQLRQSVTVKAEPERPPVPSQPSEENLPRFGSTEDSLAEAPVQDPFQEEHDNIDTLVTDLLSKQPDAAATASKDSKMMQNDDSFTNIAPAARVDSKKEEEKKDKVAAAKKGDKIEPSQVTAETHDLDKVIKDILDEEGLKPADTLVYDVGNLHKMNPEAVDEYIDEDDPGFDTYVVNEENFVASCQELAKLNNFPVRAIQPDTKHDMAHRERYRKQLDTKKKSQRAATGSNGEKTATRKLKNNDSALLLQELTKKKKKQRGEDVNDQAELE